MWNAGQQMRKSVEKRNQILCSWDPKAGKSAMGILPFEVRDDLFSTEPYTNIGTVLRAAGEISER